MKTENFNKRTKLQLQEIATEKGLNTSMLTKAEIITLLEGDTVEIKQDIAFNLKLEVMEGGTYKVLSEVAYTKDRVEEFAKSFRRAISNTARLTSMPHFIDKSYRLSIDDSSTEFVGGQFGKGIRPLLEVVASTHLLMGGSNDLSRMELVKELGGAFMDVFTIKDDFIALCNASAKYSRPGITNAQKKRIVEQFRDVVVARIEQQARKIEGVSLMIAE